MLECYEPSPQLFQVNGGSAAERAGLQAGDALIKVNSTDVFTLRHQEAQDAIRAAGVALELTVQRYGRPAITWIFTFLQYELEITCFNYIIKARHRVGLLLTGKLKKSGGK